MEYLIGIVLALVVAGGSTAVGFDRERVFYTEMTIVVAACYILFAAMGATTSVLMAEIALAFLFMLAATIGYRTSLWVVAAALAGHGLFDLVHHRLVDDPGVPAWWPGFCMGFDVTAGAYLAVLLYRNPRLVRRAGPG